MIKSNVLSCLIIGCGNIAGGFDTHNKQNELPLTHAGAFLRHGGFRLIACVEPNFERRTEFINYWKVAEGYSNIQELNDQVGRFDVISICSPTSHHYNDVEMALALKPKLLFCEKPLASNVKDAEYIVSACRNASVPLLVNYNRRWDKSVIKLKQELDAGWWGDVRSVIGVYTRGLKNNGSHMIDLLNLLLGPLELNSSGKPIFDGFPDDPSIPISLTAKNHTPVHITCGNAFDYSLFELQLITEKGVIVMEDGGMYWRIRKSIESPVFKNYRSLDAGMNRFESGLKGAMLAAVNEIYDIVNGIRLLNPSSSGSNAVYAIQLCEQAIQLSYIQTSES
jgi:predicted dehydrogenase